MLAYESVCGWAAGRRPARARDHDQLQRSNYLTLGGGVGFAVNDSVELFVDAAQIVWGESVHPLRGITVGVNTHFRTARATRIHSREQSPSAESSSRR